VHDTFFQAYDTREARRRGKSAQNGQGSEAPYDVRVSNLFLIKLLSTEGFQAIIPPIRSATLAGTHIVFSSVIPLESTDIWRTAHMFGAICSKELTDRTTHVVAAKVCISLVHGSTQMLSMNIFTAWHSES
jgi:RNA polymerase II subunit A-like phosphatase